MLCLGFRWSQECRFFFLMFFIFFIIFFGRVEVVGVDKVWVKIKGGSLVGFVDTTR